MGVGLGIVFPVIGILLEVLIAHLPFTVSTIAYYHNTRPLMWIVDTAPLIFGLTFYILGSWQDKLVKIAASLDRKMQEGLKDLNLANERLQQNMELMRKEGIAIDHERRKGKAIFDSLSDMVFLIDSDNTILECNLAVIEKFNLPIADIR
jgi:PAS domain-containing protein